MFFTFQFQSHSSEDDEDEDSFDLDNAAKSAWSENSEASLDFDEFRFESLLFS